MNGEPVQVASLEDTILIRNTQVPTETKLLKQESLRFFVENPRIYSVIHVGEQQPTQEDIQKKLLSLDHVKALIQDIKRDGGLTDPIIVRDVNFEVIEGNSRLAAYRQLAKIDPIKWGFIKCRVIPGDLDEALVFALLGQYHIKGKKDWAPFEQAGFLYRRSRLQEIETSQLADEIGLTKRQVDSLIKTYQFMLDHCEIDTARWSYYDEYLKNRKIRDARLDYAGFDTMVVGMIKSGEIPQAVDVRNRLSVICAAPKVLRKFTKCELGFEDAHERAVEVGADTTPLKKVKSFRSWLARSEVKKNLEQLQGEPRKKIVYEIDKLNNLTEQINKRLQAGS